MINVENLTKIFNENTKKEFHALKNINFEIEDFTCAILKGVSGSGEGEGRA